jgi:hypothetical protein
VSVSGVGKSAIELIVTGVETLDASTCIAVFVNAVAVTTFTPFSNTSAVVPFHLMATFEVFADVKYKEVSTPPITFAIKYLKGEAEDFILNPKEIAVASVKYNPLAEASLANARLLLKSANQVPPLAVISPFVKMLPLLITSAFLVTEAELVGM